MANSALLRNSVKPSPRLAALLVLLHLATAGVVYVAAIPLTVALLTLILIVLSLSYHLARDVLLLLPHSWREIFLDDQGVTIVARDGCRLTGQIANQTVVSPLFILMCVKTDGHFRTVSRVIFPDALSVGAFRELCVYLKFA